MKRLTMNEFREFGNRLDQVTAHELAYPLWWFLTHLRLQLDLEHSIREQLLFSLGKLVKGEVDADIGSPPIIAGADDGGYIGRRRRERVLAHE